MNDSDPAIAYQQQHLRQRLQAQRQQIALRLGPVTNTGQTFPRSLTLRWLIGPSTLSRRVVFALVIRWLRRSQANHRA